MKLWILKPVGGEWTPWYDKAAGFVVRARNEKGARSLASELHGDEGKAVWLDSAQTTCEQLTTKGPAEIVLRDFEAA